jgi:hypothetical protein
MTSDKCAHLSRMAGLYCLGFRATTSATRVTVVCSACTEPSAADRS